MIVFWIIVSVLFACSMLLISGRGSWLIAGYNTASSEEKGRYDRKKLCRASGVLLLAVDAATVPLILLHSVGYILFFAVFVPLSVIVLMVYIHKKCVIAAPAMGNSSARKVNKAVLIFIAAIAVVVVGVTAVVSAAGGRPPVYTLSDDQSVFTIDSIYGRTIHISDIKSVELLTVLPENLRRTNGYGGIGTVVKGECSSSLGDVTVFIDTARSLFVCIRTSDELIVLNGEDEDDTGRIYEMLSSAIQK